MAELVLLSTPLGNPGDITANARAALEQSTFFLAEDTKRLMNLMGFFGIDPSEKHIRPFHDHTKIDLGGIIHWIRTAKRVVLVSDAGSPVLSDPGFPLVRACYEGGINIANCPGVTSVIVALEKSSLPPIPFHFHGFFPRSASKITSCIETTLSQKGTHIFFESPKRVAATTDIIIDAKGIDRIVLARELTKVHEEFIFVDPANWPTLRQTAAFKGEFVVLYHVAHRQASLPETLVASARDYLDRPSPRNLSRILSKILDQDTKQIYRRLQNDGN